MTEMMKLVAKTIKQLLYICSINSKKIKEHISMMRREMVDIKTPSGTSSDEKCII